MGIDVREYLEKKIHDTIEKIADRYDEMLYLMVARDANHQHKLDVLDYRITQLEKYFESSTNQQQETIKVVREMYDLIKE